jgi:hypothetical protein
VQHSLSMRKREILLDWMLDVTLEVNTLGGVKRSATLSTLHMAAGLVDMFLASDVQIPGCCFQLVGAAALVLATRHQVSVRARACVCVCRTRASHEASGERSVLYCIHGFAHF